MLTQDIDTNKLLDIRCPYQRISKSDQKLYKCNSLCVKVAKGSSGEARCRKCGMNFLFVAETNAEIQTGVKAQAIS
jgi:hypothetical protein